MRSGFIRVRRASHKIRSTHFKRKQIVGSSKAALAMILTAVFLAPLSPAQAEALTEAARESLHSARALLAPNTGGQGSQSGSESSVDGYTTPQDDRSRDASRVSHFKLCPRRVELYVGESRTLVPLALDRTRRDRDGQAEVVHGLAQRWETGDPLIADVTSYGEVTAVSPGTTRVTVRVGAGQASVAVEVKPGARPVERDFDYDSRHATDCEDPEGEEVDDGRRTGSTGFEPTTNDDNLHWNQGSMESAKAALRPAMLRPAERSRGKAKFPAVRVAGAKRALVSAPASASNIAGTAMFQSPPPPIDGDLPDGSAPQATTFNNAVGNKRFGPQEVIEGSPAKTKKNLGSYNYQFVAPVLALGGRGIGTNLALTYNSRLWNADAAGMTFNYDKGWPAAGWRIGFGRIIKNYDNTATGNKSGLGVGNASGNFLLIQPDGSRIHLQQSWDPAEGVWKHDSNDGSFLHLTYQNKLKYPDGTHIKY